MELIVVVSPEGVARFVHDDDAVMALHDLGKMRAARASTVEPVSSPTWGIAWVADLTAVGGPRKEFVDRGNALAWERGWIEGHNVPEPRP